MTKAKTETDGKLIVALQGNTALEDKLQEIADGKVTAPQGRCVVVCPGILIEAKEAIKELREQLANKT